MIRYLILFLVIIFNVSNLNANPAPINISAGNKDGVYYKIASVICKFINFDENQKFCHISESAGSEENIKRLFSSQNNVIIAQAEAIEVIKQNSEDHYQILHNIANLYEEVLTIIVNQNSPISNLSDLRNANILIYDNNTGIKYTLLNILKSMNMNSNQVNLFSVDKEQFKQKLCNNDELNNMGILIYGHPSDIIYNLSRSCNLKIINLTKSEIENIKKTNSHYKASKIAGGLYYGNPNDINSISTDALLITKKTLPDSMKNILINALINNIEKIKKLHPVLNNLSKENINNSN